MATVMTVVAVTTYSLAGNLSFAVLALVFWIGVVRSLRARVSVTPSGIEVCGVARTTKVPWSEVAGIEAAQPLTGPAGLFGASAPVIVRAAKQGQGSKRIMLNVLGNYGLGPRPGPADRAVAELKEHLQRVSSMRRR